MFTSLNSINNNNNYNLFGRAKQSKRDQRKWLKPNLSCARMPRQCAQCTVLYSCSYLGFNKYTKFTDYRYRKLNNMSVCFTMFEYSWGFFLKPTKCYLIYQLISISIEVIKWQANTEQWTICLAKRMQANQNISREYGTFRKMA